MKVIRRLREKGYSAYAVGGCVRDSLMGKVPHDYDIATSALPEEVSALFEKTVPTGVKYGTVTVITEDGPVEVTAFRKDGEYHDGRRPKSVTFTADIADDLSRRDFTVNAMAASINREIIDPFGGLRDIEDKVIKCVGEADRRFSEDALRIMRAFRFASALDFKIEQNTLSAAIKMSNRLSQVSAERIFTELIKTIMGRRVSVLIPIIEAGGLTFLGIKEAHGLYLLDGKTCRVSRETAFAAFCHVCGCDIYDLCRILKADRKLMRESVKIEKAISSLPAGREELKRKLCSIGENNIYDAMYMACAVFEGDYPRIKSEIDDIFASGEAYKLSMLDIRGSDVGFSVEQRGKILKSLLEYVIKNPGMNKKDILLRYAEDIWRGYTDECTPR